MHGAPTGTRDQKPLKVADSISIKRAMQKPVCYFSKSSLVMCGILVNTNVQRISVSKTAG